MDGYYKKKISLANAEGRRIRYLYEAQWGKNPGYPLQSQRKDLGFLFFVFFWFFFFHFFVYFFEQWCGNLDVTGFMLPDGVGSIVIRVSSVSKIGAEK